MQWPVTDAVVPFSDSFPSYKPLLFSSTRTKFKLEKKKKEAKNYLIPTSKTSRNNENEDLPETCWSVVSVSYGYNANITGISETVSM